MAGNVGGIRAGKAFIEAGLNDSKLVAGIKRAEAQLKGFSRSVDAIGGRVGGAISGAGSIMGEIGKKVGAAGLTMAAPFGLAIKSAGDMMETSSKLDATFKDSAGAVREWANAYAAEVGRSKAQTQGFVADAGALLSGFGFDTKQTASMSQTITGLSTDLASFLNMADVDAFGALMSGLSGEAEPLKRFGVLLNETRLKAELLSKGIDPTAASEQQKVLGRLNIILAATKDAQGDAIRTSGSFNNSMKRLQATVSDLAVNVGEALLPQITSLVSQAATAAKSFGLWISQNPGLVKSAAALAVGVTGVGLALAGLGPILGAVGTAVTTFSAGLALLVSPIGLITAGLVAGAGAWLAYSTTGQEALAWLAGRFGELRTTALATFEGIATALKGGDIALAGRILWAGLKVAWVQGTNALNAVWTDWSTAFLQVMADAKYAVAGVFLDLADGIRLVWNDVTSHLKGSWGDLIKGMITTFNPLTAALQYLSLDVGGAVEQALNAGGFETGKAAQIREAGRAQIGQENMAAHQALTDQQTAETDARRAAMDAALQGDAEAFAKAQAELDAALKQARELKIPVADAGSGKAGSGPKAFETPDTMAAGIDAALADAKAKVDVVGTFNASNLAGLGAGSSVANDQLKEARKTNEKLDNVKRAVETSRFVFTS